MMRGVNTVDDFMKLIQAQEVLNDFIAEEDDILPFEQRREEMRFILNSLRKREINLEAGDDEENGDEEID